MARKRSRSKRSRKAPVISPTLRSRLSWVGAGVILFILLRVFVLQDEGVYQLFKLRGEIKELERRIATLENQNKELEQERDRLLNDPEYLERIARERFRMAKPGEKVFHVVIEEKRRETP